MTIIKSKKFILRPYRKGDEKDLVKNLNDQKVSRFMCHVPYPYTLKDAREWIRNCIKAQKIRKKKKEIFAIEINSEV